ncbi:MAG: DUF1932 domain-containing protein [Dehalococcoidia bacterium]
MLPQSPRLGVIGFGEVGYHISKGLKGAGVGQIVAYNNGTRNRPPYTEAFRHKAQSIGVSLAPTLEEMVHNSDLILSTVIPTTSLEVAGEAAPLLTPAHFFVDLNSCSPEAKREGCALVEEKGGHYIDGVIMDNPLAQEHRSNIWACGEGAEEFHQVMGKYSMNIRVIPGKVGDAALLKMIFSVIAKGAQALLWESLLALHKAGLDPQVYHGLNNWVSQMGLLERADAVIAHSAIHAGRRAGEMEFAADTLLSLGVEPMMARATAQRLAWSAGFNFPDQFPDEFPSGYKAVFEVMDRITAEGQART